MEVDEAIRTRVSVRSYDARPVPCEIITKLIALAHLAPSSCNLQLTEYIVVDDPMVREQLAQHVTPKFRWSPTFIVFIYDPRFTVERHSAVTSMGASVQNILLGATARGLSCCPMAGFRNDAMLKKILHIPDTYEAGLIMSIGYAAPNLPKKMRSHLPDELITHWNGYEQHGTLMQDSPRLHDWTINELINYRRRIAPVYRYPDHLKLHIFMPEVYKAIAERVAQAMRNTPDARVLDLVTYDAFFLIELIRRAPHLQMHATDYISFTLDVLRAEHASIATHLISEKNKIEEAPPCNALTCVFKLEHTPDWKQMLTNALTTLAPDGRCFIAIIDEPLLKGVRNALRWWYARYVKHETVNVYEKNPYYRIGPFRAVTAHDVCAWAKKNRLVIIKKEHTSVRGDGTLAQPFWFFEFKNRAGGT